MKKRAFTLFELLVSISIIGILIAVASLSYGSAQKKTRDARRMEDMNAIQKAMEMYYSQNNYQYPTTTAMLIGSSAIQSWPKDPKNVAYPNPILSTTSYCICASLDNLGTGNYYSGSCAIIGTSKDFYCVKNQQ